MSNIKTKRKIQKEVRKSVKRLSAGAIFAIIICLIVGVVGGFFANKLITKAKYFYEKLK